MELYMTNILLSQRDFCMVTEHLKYLVCLTDVLPHSKTKANVTNDIVTGGRPMTS